MTTNTLEAYKAAHEQYIAACRAEKVDYAEARRLREELESLVPDQLEQLYIRHNHGFLHLREVTLQRYTYTPQYGGGGPRQCCDAIGTVVDGATTSRLFHVTSTTRKEPGKVETYPLYGRVPQLRADGIWEVNCEFCG